MPFLRGADQILIRAVRLNYRLATPNYQLNYQKDIRSESSLRKMKSRMVKPHNPDPP
jgi:riboflavin transporter FmnP